ncbi:MAG: AI-2E family transporter [Chitinophagales bacterium]|nr:MAG: AI-2E family transporter [Chitinophagales bacterium]
MNTPPRWLALLISIIVFAAVAWYFKNIVAYLLIAGVLSVVGQPLMELLAGKKIIKFRIPRSIAALLTMTIMLLISTLFASIFIPLITRQAQIISSMDMQELIGLLREPLTKVESYLHRLGLLKDETLQHYIQSRLYDMLSFSNVTQLLNNFFGALGDLFIAFASVTFILFFFLKEKDLFYRIIIALTPSGSEKKMETVFRESRIILARYVRGVILQIILLSLIIWAGLSVAGIPNALLIAFFAGLFNIIPYLGPALGGMMAIMLSVTSSLTVDASPEMLWLIIKTAAVFVIAQLIDNYLLQPFIFSSSVKAHPLEIFLVILAGGTVGGIAGMVLAVPVYTILRLLAREFFSQFKVVQELTDQMTGND